LVSSQIFSSRNTAVGKARALPNPLARGADKPEQSGFGSVGGQTRLFYLPLTVTARLGYFDDEGLEADQGGLRGALPAAILDHGLVGRRPIVSSRVSPAAADSATTEQKRAGFVDAAAATRVDFLERTSSSFADLEVTRPRWRLAQ
jgi:hypothetical protein